MNGTTATIDGSGHALTGFGAALAGFGLPVAGSVATTGADRCTPYND